MEGVTSMLAWLGHVPGSSRAGLYGPANIDFRFVGKLRLQRAATASVRRFQGCTEGRNRVLTPIQDGFDGYRVA